MSDLERDKKIFFEGYEHGKVLNETPAYEEGERVGFGKGVLAGIIGTTLLAVARELWKKG